MNFQLRPNFTYCGQYSTVMIKLTCQFAKLVYTVFRNNYILLIKQSIDKSYLFL